MKVTICVSQQYFRASDPSQKHDFDDSLVILSFQMLKMIKTCELCHKRASTYRSSSKQLEPQEAQTLLGNKCKNTRC